MKVKQLKIQSEAEIFSVHKSGGLYATKTDAEVWSAFLSGEGEAFNHIYRQYFPQLFNYAYQFTRDRELIKDQIQDLFVYLKTHRTSLGKTNSIKYYLYSSLRRSIARKISKQSEMVGLGPEDSLDFEIAVSNEDLVLEIEQQQINAERIQRGLGYLTKRQKEAVVYFYFEGFSYEQIAELMDLGKAEYARKLIYRAIAAMKAALKE